MVQWAAAVDVPLPKDVFRRSCDLVGGLFSWRSFTCGDKMKRFFLVLICLFPATSQAQQPQKIAAYNDFFTTMDWIAYDQYGTYGRGNTEQEAIEDCRKEYAMRLQAVGIKEEQKVTNERKNITHPSDWWAAFEAQAKAEGLTLAAWLGEAAKAKLTPKVAKKLTERPPENRPPKAKD